MTLILMTHFYLIFMCHKYAKTGMKLINLELTLRSKV